MSRDRSPRRLQRFFWFTYHAAERDLQLAKGPSPFKRQLHLVRDALAFAELASLLTAEGLQYETALISLPAIGFRRSKVQPDNVQQFGPDNVQQFGPEDLLLMVTRPPLDDPEPPTRG